MTGLTAPGRGATSRLALLPEHVAHDESPRDVRRATHPLADMLRLVVCGTMAEDDPIIASGETQLEVLRRHLPHADGVPGGPDRHGGGDQGGTTPPPPPRAGP